MKDMLRLQKTTSNWENNLRILLPWHIWSHNFEFIEIRFISVEDLIP
jgi:hypothetical protein